MNKLQNREKDRSKTEINESCCLCGLEELILLRCLLPLPSPEDTAWSRQQRSNQGITFSKRILKTPGSVAGRSNFLLKAETGVNFAAAKTDTLHGKLGHKG